MFIAGQARMLIDLQEVTTTTDTNGAPVRGYASALQCYAMVESERYDVQDSDATGAREESIKSMTLIIRNPGTPAIHSRMRINVIGTGEYYNIKAIRYDMRATTCYIDCEGGQANG